MFNLGRSRGDVSMKIPPTEAARIMGVSPQFIRCGLQQNKFPFGVAVKMEKQWSYYINKEKFFEYIEKPLLANY